MPARVSESTEQLFDLKTQVYSLNANRLRSTFLVDLLLARTLLLHHIK